MESILTPAHRVYSSSPSFAFLLARLPSKEKLHNLGEKTKCYYRKGALVISFSRGKWSFFRSVFHFLYLQQFAIFPFFHLFCFYFAFCYFVAFCCWFSTKIKTVTLIIGLCNHNSAALFKTDKKNRFLFATYCRCDSIVYVVKESGFRRILWLISYSVKLK